MPIKQKPVPYRVIVDRMSMIDGGYQRKAVIRIDSKNGKIIVKVKKPYSGKADVHEVELDEPLSGMAAVAYVLNKLRDKL